MTVRDLGSEVLPESAFCLKSSGKQECAVLIGSPLAFKKHKSIHLNKLTGSTNVYVLNHCIEGIHFAL